MTLTLRSLFFLFLWVVTGTGCRKFVTLPPPPGSPTADILFSTEASARGILSGVYSEMIAPSVFSSSLATLYSGLAADELYYFTPGLRDEFTRNELTPASHSTLSTGFWQPSYRFIYTANLALEKLPGTAGIPEQARRELIGEARFIRAFCYFYLVNFFGDTPLVLTTDYRQAGRLPRAAKREVYALILEDLRKAEAALPPAPAPRERLRPNRQSAVALRARVHLYLGQWADAAAAASEVIDSPLLGLAERPDSIFMEHSRESIFYLPAPPPYFTLPEAAAILPLGAATAPTYLLRPELLDAFEPGDRRRDAWVRERVYGGNRLYFPTKYKGGSGEKEGYVVLRLAEQYLVRAEARAELGDLDGALSDLNTVRQRSELQRLPALNKNDLFRAVAQERRVELFSEWGHRWSDLRRRGEANAVLRPMKGPTWQSTDSLWPIPGDQMALNEALTQNPGY